MAERPRRRRRRPPRARAAAAGPRPSRAGCATSGGCAGRASRAGPRRGRRGSRPRARPPPARRCRARPAATPWPQWYEPMSNRTTAASERALVDQHVVVAPMRGPDREAARPPGQVDDRGDPAAADVGEGVLPDVAADVELRRQLVAVLVVGVGRRRGLGVPRFVTKRSPERVVMTRRQAAFSFS